MQNFFLTFSPLTITVLRFPSPVISTLMNNVHWSSTHTQPFNQMSFDFCRLLKRILSCLSPNSLSKQRKRIKRSRNLRFHACSLADCKNVLSNPLRLLPNFDFFAKTVPKRKIVSVCARLFDFGLMMKCFFKFNFHTEMQLSNFHFNFTHTHTSLKGVTGHSKWKGKITLHVAMIILGDHMHTLANIRPTILTGIQNEPKIVCVWRFVSENEAFLLLRRHFGITTIFRWLFRKRSSVGPVRKLSTLFWWSKRT